MYRYAFRNGLASLSQFEWLDNTSALSDIVEIVLVFLTHVFVVTTVWLVFWSRA